MRRQPSKHDIELKSEERRALIWLGLLAVVVAFYFWLKDSDPNAAPYVNFFCNSPCPHITLYWIPFLQTLMFYWIGYAGCMLVYFSEDFFHKWGWRGRIFRRYFRTAGHIFISFYPAVVLIITVFGGISFLLPPVIQGIFLFLVYYYFVLGFVLRLVERFTGRRHIVRRFLWVPAREGAKELWRKIRHPGEKFRLPCRNPVRSLRRPLVPVSFKLRNVRPLLGLIIGFLAGDFLVHLQPQLEVYFPIGVSAAYE